MEGVHPTCPSFNDDCNMRPEPNQQRHPSNKLATVAKNIAINFFLVNIISFLAIHFLFGVSTICLQYWTRSAILRFGRNTADNWFDLYDS